MTPSYLPGSFLEGALLIAFAAAAFLTGWWLLAVWVILMVPLIWRQWRREQREPASREWEHRLPWQRSDDED